MENEKNIVQKAHEREKSDSFKIGSATKGGAVSVYFDLSSMTDEEVIKLTKRARELYTLMTQ